MAMETALSIRARIVIFQELFIGNQELCHSAFNFYWLQRNKTEIRAMTAVKKDIQDKIVVEHRTDKINYPYFILLKIRELNQQLKRPGRKMQVLNIYQN